jgi:hypothetical protein
MYVALAADIALQIHNATRHHCRYTALGMKIVHVSKTNCDEKILEKSHIHMLVIMSMIMFNACKMYNRNTDATPSICTRGVIAAFGCRRLWCLFNRIRGRKKHALVCDQLKREIKNASKSSLHPILYLCIFARNNCWFRPRFLTRSQEGYLY